MLIGAIDKAFTFTGPGLDACLCLLMVVKGRWTHYPALFTLVLLDLISGITLYGIDPAGSSRIFTRFYLVFDVVSFLLQLAVLHEIAKNVLRPTGIWSRAALKPLLLTSVAGAAVALLATLFLQPSGISGPQAIELRAELFTGLLTCEIVIAMMLSAKEVGLPWRSHVMAIGQGLMLFQLVTVSIVGFEAYIGPHSPYYNNLYYLRSAAYFVIVIYWTVSLWSTEPVRKPISPALRKYVVALHKSVEYDLGKVGH